MADELEFRTQGTELPYGARKELARQTAFAEAAAPPSPPAEPRPVAEAVPVEEEPPAMQLVSPAGADELDAFLFAPTDFPDRPLTDGAPFGPGRNELVLPQEDERAFLHRVARRMLEEPGVPEDAKVWAARVIAGM